MFIGNAIKDAQVKTAKESGNASGDFAVAVRCFGKLAASVTNIKKGAKVFVDGELEIGAFAGKDGKKQVTFRVLANAYRLLGTGRQTAEEPTQE